MYIKNLHFKNFKRFADLQINLCPEAEDQPPKLVLLIGANGSGKSSVFDGFEVANQITKRSPIILGEYSLLNEIRPEYYSKSNLSFNLEIVFTDVTLSLNQQGNNSDIISNLSNNLAFYGRSSFRYTPKITKTNIGTAAVDTTQDSDRPTHYTDLDNRRFDNDLDTLVQSILKAFNEENPKIKSIFNKKFNDAFKAIFGQSKNISLQYIDFETPADGKPFQFLFKKGDSQFSYDLLSAGEKMVFELLFNLYSREKLYQDSIVFLDEIDLHLNTSLQKNLLKEITENWIPEKSQLWVASHSLGFIDYAREYERGTIIDFDNLDFDLKQELKPKPDDQFDVYQVVFGDTSFIKKYLKLSATKAPKIFVTEGKDSLYYEQLNSDDVIFTTEYSKLNKNGVVDLSKTRGIYGLIDRDFLSDLEILKAKNKYPNLRILNFYCLENYLYHPHNLIEVNPNFDLEIYKKAIKNRKNESIERLKLNIGYARSKYPDFIINDQDLEVSRLLDSDNFENYYKVFSIKENIDLVSSLNLKKSDLVKTAWFKTQIQKVLES